jgi:hypothetical protein
VILQSRPISNLTGKKIFNLPISRVFSIILALIITDEKYLAPPKGMATG